MLTPLSREVYDGESINKEGAAVCINDAGKDGFNAVGVRCLITRGRGVDSKANDDVTTRALGAGSDTTLHEVEVLGV
jgi:hypothetical protein